MPIQTPVGLQATNLMMLFYVFEKNTWNYGKKQVLDYYQQISITLNIGNRKLCLSNNNAIQPLANIIILDTQA